MKFIFIDRDGVINRDPGGWTKYNYVTEWRDFHFLPGSLEAIKKLTDAGYEIVIISNQAGINKGYYTLDKLNEITNSMLEEIKRNGGEIRSIHYCPHREEDNCSCRKPKTGLFKKAVEGEDINFRNTYFIGDGIMDIEAGKKVGCKTVFVLSGKDRLEDLEKSKIKPDFVKKDLEEAVDWILLMEVK